MSKLNRILSLGLLAAAAAFPANAKEVRFAPWLPPTHPVVAGAAAPFAERVTEATHGELTFKIIAGGSLLGPKDTVDGLRDGVADMGQVAFSYFPAQFPYTTLIGDLAMLGRNPMAVTAATTEYTMMDCKPCQQEYRNAGIVHLGATSTAAYQLLSVKPLVNVEDFKGVKVRTPGLVWDRWVESLGGTSVSIPANEMYEGMSRGQLDAALSSTGSLKSYSLWDVAKNVTEVSLGSFRSWGVLTVGVPHWDSLSLEDRKIYLASAARGVLEATANYVRQDNAAIEEGAANGLTVHQPSPGLIEATDKFIATDRATIVEDAKDKMGIADPEPIIDAYAALIAKWEERFKGLTIENDMDKMVQMLDEEVFAKVDPATYGM